ncbi:MAG: hydroxyethylthiazole kinase, partial [Geminicoccaceae bacterium]
MTDHDDESRLIPAAAGVLVRLRAERPRVHCLTTFVAMQLTANLLLAAGAVPSMTMDAREMPAFVETSRALLVNLGMLDPWREAAIPAAIEAAA